MAEKILNTRILLKTDTLENWNSSTLKIKKGEICIATVAASAGTGLTEPVCMIKIGTDEEKTFSELPWSFHAKASDVLTACKSEAGLKAFVNGVIADAGIATNEAMEALAGRVTTAEGEIDTLQSEMDAVEAKAAANETAIGELDTLVGDKAVATQISEAIAALDLANTYDAKGAASQALTDAKAYADAEDAKIEARVDTLEAAIAQDGAVDTKIKNAIDALDVTDTAVAGKYVSAVNEVDGKVVITRADLPDYTETYDAKGAAATAKSEAIAHADDLNTAMDQRVAALELIDHDHANKAELDKIADGDKVKWDAMEQNAKDYTDAEIEEWVGDKTVGVQISEAIANEKLAETYAPIKHTHVKADITDFAHTHEITEVNGLQDALDGKQAVGDYATKTEAQGYADAKDEAIAAAKKAGDDAQAAADKAQEEVDALETYVGTIPETAEATNIVAYVQEKTAGIATDAALGELTDRVATAEDEIDALQAELDTAETGLKARMTAAEADIDALEELVGDTKVSEAISTAVAAEAEIARAAEKANADAIDAIETDYLKAADKKELQDQIDANESAIELLTNGVSADEVDGVNDLINYVKEHGTEVTGMKADIKANTDAIAAEKQRAEGIEGGLETRLAAVEGKLGDEGDIPAAIEGAVTEAKGYTDAEIKKLAEGAVATNTADIAALDALVGDKAVAEQITDVTDGLDERIEALEAIDHEHANKALLDTYTQTEADLADAVAKKHEHANKAELDKIAEGDKAAWDAKVDDVTAAADSGLKATRTGNTVAIEIDDTITFVLDCGDSTTV